MIEIDISKYIRFDVTGIDRRGIRFKQSYPGTISGGMMAMAVNLWQGSVWGVNPSGKRKLLKRVYN